MKKMTDLERQELEIIKHYGALAQLKYLQSEVFELNEAIINHELKQSVEYEIPLTELIGTREHIIEELADVEVMLTQFRLLYNISCDEINDVMVYKIGRQIQRIENETH